MLCCCTGQVLFPASYAETAAWLRATAIGNQGTLQRCKTRLQEALAANQELQRLCSRVEVCPHTAICVRTDRKRLRLKPSPLVLTFVQCILNRKESILSCEESSQKWRVSQLLRHGVACSLCGSFTAREGARLPCHLQRRSVRCKLAAVGIVLLFQSASRVAA